MSYRWMVGNLFTQDKMTYIYDTLSLKNSIKVQMLGSIFREYETLDSVVLSKVGDRNQASGLLENILLSKKDIQAIYLYQLKRGKHHLIGKSSRHKKFDLKTKDLTSYVTGKDFEIKKFQDDAYLLYHQYKKNNTSYALLKIVNFKGFKRVLSSDKTFNTLVIDKNQRSILFGKESWSAASELTQNEKVSALTRKKNFAGGVLTTAISDEKYILAFGFLNSDILVISSIMENKALTVIKELNIKSIFFLLISITTTGILSIFVSRKLTNTLKELSEATNKVREGDYDIEIGKMSNDEIGDLAKSFQFMASEISGLLNQLKEYNVKLEKLVEKRTEELNHSLKLQKAMVNSLNEGFMLVRPDGTVTDTYSKSCESIFELKPKGKFVGAILESPEEEHEDLKNLFKEMAKDSALFMELKKFLPEQVKLSNNKVIYVDYSPVNNEDKSVSGIVVSAADRTKEHQAIEEIEEQKAYVQMVITILKDKNNYFDFMQEVKELHSLYYFKKIMKQEDFEALYREVHTLKGKSDFYRIEDLTAFLDRFEDELEKIIPVEHKGNGYREQLSKLDQLVQNICREQSSWLGVNPYQQGTEQTISLAYSKINNFARLLKGQQVNMEIMREFITQLASVPLMSFFDRYEDLITYLSKVENVKVDKVNWQGMDLKVPAYGYGQLFRTFVHLYRNMLSHGFKGKSGGENVITTMAEVVKENNKKYLLLKVSDNGVGIDINKLKEKAKLRGDLEDNISDDKILDIIFKQGFSTQGSATRIAGRGVGLSAFKEELEKLGGNVTVQTVQGQGTVFIIKVPYVFKMTMTGDKSWQKAA
jgi:two-component system chemotaxis sensor kinase CheA